MLNIFPCQPHPSFVWSGEKCYCCTPVPRSQHGLCPLSSPCDGLMVVCDTLQELICKSIKQQPRSHGRGEQTVQFISSNVCWWAGSKLQPTMFSAKDIFFPRITFSALLKMKLCEVFISINSLSLCFSWKTFSTYYFKHRYQNWNHRSPTCNETILGDNFLCSSVKCHGSRISSQQLNLGRGWPKTLTN